MTRYLHQVAVQEKAVSADGVEVFDLTVNPLSVVLLNIRPLNNTGTLADFADYMAICDSLNRVSILLNGQSVVNAKGVDIAALNYLRRGVIPREANDDNTDNERRCVTLPIFLGRMPFDSSSCLPASKRGELVMELDIDVADTGYDGFRYSVETIELPGANPKEYERVSAINKTFAATGDQDFDLPPGSLYRGLMLWGTTPFVGASPAPSWGRVSLLADNMQEMYGATDFESFFSLNSLLGRLPPSLGKHKHIITTDGNAQVALATLVGPYGLSDGSALQNYGFLDLDPTRDDEFALDSSNFNSFRIRSTVETADAVRVLPIERVKV